MVAVNAPLNNSGLLYFEAGYVSLFHALQIAGGPMKIEVNRVNQDQFEIIIEDQRLTLDWDGLARLNRESGSAAHRRP